MATQITADGVGQLFMMAISVIGVVMLIDVYQFTQTDTDFFSSMSITININEKVRALAEATLGICLFLFGIGRWTAQVGGTAIFLVLFLASGHYWDWNSTGKGAVSQQQVTRAASTKDEVLQCPLSENMKLWCRQDTDGDGTVNQYDTDYNSGTRSGRANCANGYYLSKQGEACL